MRRAAVLRSIRTYKRAVLYVCVGAMPYYRKVAATLDVMVKGMSDALASHVL